MCYFKPIIFVSKFDIDDNQITFYDKLIKKSMKFAKVQNVFLPPSSIDESHMKITNYKWHLPFSELKAESSLHVRFSLFSSSFFIFSGVSRGPSRKFPSSFKVWILQSSTDDVL